MNILKVCGREDLAKFRDGGFTHMISIGDPDDEFDGLRLPGVCKDNHLLLTFADIHNPDEPDAPSREKLEPLFAWLETRYEMERLLVHCLAGLGRSPAVALLVLCVVEPSVPARFHLRKVAASAESNWIMPNLLVARIGETLLHREGEIYPVVRAWRAAQE